MIIIYHPFIAVLVVIYSWNYHIVNIDIVSHVLTRFTRIMRSLAQCGLLGRSNG